MDAALDAVLEIFSWVGIGAGLLLGVIALIAHLADGTWAPVRVAIEQSDRGPLARWFDHEGGVNEAYLTGEQHHSIGDVEWADVFVRVGGRGRLRLTRHSPLVRAVSLLAAGLVGVGVVSLIIAAVLLFARG